MAEHLEPTVEAFADTSAQESVLILTGAALLAVTAKLSPAIASGLESGAASARELVEGTGGIVAGVTGAGALAIATIFNRDRRNAEQ